MNSIRRCSVQTSEAAPWSEEPDEFNLLNRYERKKERKETGLHVEGQIRMMAKPEFEMTKGNRTLSSRDCLDLQPHGRYENSGDALAKCGEYKMWRKNTQWEENWNTSLTGERTMFTMPEGWEKKRKGKAKTHLQIVKLYEMKIIWEIKPRPSYN